MKLDLETKKNINLFFSALFIFSAVFFVLFSYLTTSIPKFSSPEEFTEKTNHEEYIDLLISKSENKKKPAEIEKPLPNQIKNIFFIPILFKNNLNKIYSDNIKKLISSKIFSLQIEDLKIFFVKNKKDIRGKMKNKNIFLFGSQKYLPGEILSVFVHELGHYVDLYFMKKINNYDLSSSFYNISWNGVKNIKKGQKQIDFVSGYSMTNKYEDFAETFAYFILHNNDFKEKSKQSLMLKKKYDFFTKYIFKNNEFENTDFGKSQNKPKKYYRDITKILINYKNFLQFITTGV